MQPTTLDQLKKLGYVDLLSDGIRIRIDSTWVISGESHLSYTTITRMVECCREHHWEKDITSLFSGKYIDSICKSMNVEFLKPIPLDIAIQIKYRVLNIRSKGYELYFKITDNQNHEMEEIFAIFSVVFVFYNTQKKEVISIPERIMKRLNELS